MAGTATLYHPEWMIIFSLAIALVPLFVGVFTSYLKVSVVLAMLRSGIGAQNVPGGLITMALSIGLTLSIMAPVLEQTRTELSGILPEKLAHSPQVKNLHSLTPVLQPWIDFLKTHTGDRELAAFGELHGGDSLRALCLAYITSELKEAFVIGFIILLPFLVVDLIVANLLVGLGMFMVSPVMISLPIKLFLFVIADGWLLLTTGLIRSYAG